PPGHLARVPGLVVNVLQEGHELVAKYLVIVGAPQPPRVAEFQECDVADRTRLLVRRRGLARYAGGAGQLLGQFAHRRALRRLLRRRQVLAGVFVAEVVLARLAAFDIGDMKGRRLGALVALHGTTPPSRGGLARMTAAPPGGSGDQAHATLA